MTSLTSNPSAVRFDDSNSKFNQAVSTSVKDFKEKKYEIMYVLNSDPSKELQEVNAVENTETSVTYKRADYYQAADDAGANINYEYVSASHQDPTNNNVYEYALNTENENSNLTKTTKEINNHLEEAKMVDLHSHGIGADKNLNPSQADISSSRSNTGVTDHMITSSAFDKNAAVVHDSKGDLYSHTLENGNRTNIVISDEDGNVDVNLSSNTFSDTSINTTGDILAGAELITYVQSGGDVLELNNSLASKGTVDSEVVIKTVRELSNENIGHTNYDVTSSEFQNKKLANKMKQEKDLNSLLKYFHSGVKDHHESDSIGPQGGASGLRVKTVKGEVVPDSNRGKGGSYVELSRAA